MKTLLSVLAAFLSISGTSGFAQNTPHNVGNDTAFDIVVADTLDPNLDITTLELGAHSHNYQFDISGRELT